MIIGVPTEIKNNENRVAMTPGGVETLVQRHHKVLIQNNAGVNSGFLNEAYIDAGAIIIETAAEIWATADMIVKVKEPQPVEIAMARKDQTVFTYFHFAADKELTDSFLKSGATAIAYETVESPNHSLPLLKPMSEVAGRMATQEGAKFLEKRMGGRGILLGGVPGVKPATVMILGGGIVGTNAAKMAAGLGAQVYMFDLNINRLRELDDIMPANVFTMYSTSANIKKLLPQTDLLIGAVLVPGAKAPALVTKNMLKLMRKGSVVVDVAVDQGGCIETCRPTTHEKPTFLVHGIVHYCVANMPGAVPYTSTIALTNATLPYVLKIADMGPVDALKSDDGFKLGLNMYKGNVTCKAVADAFSMEYSPAETLLG